jgi:hypothetical protein
MLNSDRVEDHVKATEELRDTYSDLLDLPYESLSDGFLSSKENLDLLKEAANGSVDAYNQLALAAQQDM